MATDHLDIAYMGIGAKQALASSDPSYGVGPYEGELAYVDACIEHAALLDQAWEIHREAISAVWCYEVAEPFGYELGKHLLGGGDPSAARAVLNRVIAVATVDSSP